jgi:hypothetical protein
MRAAAMRAVMVVLLAGTMPLVCVGAEPSLTLTVRVYNSARIPAPELLAARQAAEWIFQGTGVTVIFRQCGHPALPQDRIDRCDESLTPSEVVVRIIDAPAFNPDLHSEAYGVAYVVKETNRGWLATVFSDRIGGAATRVGVDAGTLLGLVMAHEVGHLLLGVGYHSELGVMRADWPDGLLNFRNGQWHFSTLEAARMREAAAVGF